jgi:hypothetical protein
VAVAVSFAVVLATRTRPVATYGGLPSWLPTAKVDVGRVVQASAAHPWRAIEGDAVSVRVGGGRVLATVVGPDVPEDGKFPVPATSPCTFTVTLSGLAGEVPLVPRAFTILDELGHLHRPQVTAAGGGAVPTEIRAGRTVTLTVRDVLPTGGGRVRWSPGGTTPIVSWDFDVEID